MSHRRGGAHPPVTVPPTAPRSRGGPSSDPSRFFRSPPPPPPQSDPFLEECGGLSLFRNAPFLRQEKLNPANLPRDERALSYHILFSIFGFQNAHHHPNRRPPYTDAEAAELALTDYFQTLGPRRVHLLLPTPAEVLPSCLLRAAAATPAAPAEGGKDELAGVKRARDDFSKPPRSQSYAADERSSVGKKTCASPDPVNPPAGRSSPGAGVTSTGDTPAVGCRRRRNLPPSILCPDDWEDARTGYVTRLRPVPPPPQVDQTPEKADPLEALAKGAFSMPVPKWWRPGGYGGRSTPPDK